MFQTTRQAADVMVSVRYAEVGEETPQSNGYAKIRRDHHLFYVALSRQWVPDPSVWHILAMLPLSELLLEQGTLTLHASYILHKGQAILFSGPSGIGKSTQAELWGKYRGAQIINGDRVLLSPKADACLVNSHYLCGTSGVCQNVEAPLKAIVLLDQGPENQVRRPSPVDIFRLLMSQFDYDFRDRGQIAAVTALLESITATVKVCRFACRMDESAVLDLEKYLYEECDCEDNSKR